MRPNANARDDVLFQIRGYQRRIMKEDKWSKEEKEELLRFLGIQATSWGMLEDDLGSKSVKEMKENMLLETWRKFTEGMKTRQPKGKKGKSKKVKNTGVKKEGGLEGEPATSATIVQGDVKTLTDGIETPVGKETPVGQTVLNQESASKETEADDKETGNAEQTKLS